MEKPILFSGKMVTAILDGRKTQTRRVIKPQPVVPKWTGKNWVEVGSDNVIHRYIRCPYGLPHDTLWVRETWQAQSGNDGRWWHEVKRVERSLHNWAWTNPVRPAYDSTPPKWMPSIHMPRWASRLTLRVVNVRVERVQKISKADAIAEGIHPFWVNYGKTTNKAKFWRVNESDDGGYQNPTEAFENLWDSINAKRGYSWDSNPWVWVVEFEVVK